MYVGEACGSASDTIKQVRATNREDLSALRKHDRDALLRQKRLRLCEVEALVTSITLEQFKELSLKVKGKKASIEVLKAIKNNCCTSARAETFIKTEGALNSLIRFLVGRDAQMQLESAACLTNLVCSSHKASQRVAKAAGPYLVSFLGSGSFYLQDQSAWAIGNIANCCFQCFSLLKSQGLVPALLSNIQTCTVPNVFRSTIFALNACTKYEDNDYRELANDGTINHLLELLDKKYLPQSAHSDATFALSNILFLTAKNDTHIEDTTIKSIINHFYDSVFRKDLDVSIAVPLLRCLGFVSHREYMVQNFSMHPKFKKTIFQIFHSHNHCLIMELLWILTNISGGCDLTTQDVDLNELFKIISLNNPKDSSTVQVLYFLCTWASRSVNVRGALQLHEFASQIEKLLSCGEKTVENGAKVLLGI